MGYVAIFCNSEFACAVQQLSRTFWLVMSWKTEHQVIAIFSRRTAQSCQKRTFLYSLLLALCPFVQGTIVKLLFDFLFTSIDKW